MTGERAGDAKEYVRKLGVVRVEKEDWGWIVGVFRARSLSASQPLAKPDCCCFKELHCTLAKDTARAKGS
jgi:hypothetical protein